MGDFSESELLGGVQVYKTQDSSIIPGGIAATRSSIRWWGPPDPLTYEGPAPQLRAGPTYNHEAANLSSTTVGSAIAPARDISPI